MDVVHHYIAFIGCSITNMFNSCYLKNRLIILIYFLFYGRWIHWLIQELWPAYRSYAEKNCIQQIDTLNFTMVNLIYVEFFYHSSFLWHTFIFISYHSLFVPLYPFVLRIWYFGWLVLMKLNCVQSSQERIMLPCTRTRNWKLQPMNLILQIKLGREVLVRSIRWIWSRFDLSLLKVIN